MGKPSPQKIRENVLDLHNKGMSIRQISAQARFSTEFIRNSTRSLFEKYCCVTKQTKTEVNASQLSQLSTFIAYLKIPYVTGAWENYSKGFFRRIRKNTETSEVKQWLMPIGMPGIERLADEFESRGFRLTNTVSSRRRSRTTYPCCQNVCFSRRREQWTTKCDNLIILNHKIA